MKLIILLPAVMGGYLVPPSVTALEVNLSLGQNLDLLYLKL